MAKPESKIKELSQIKIGSLDIIPPDTKIRIHWNVLPDLTIDLARTPGTGLASILKPRATVLIGGAAYRLDPWSAEKVIKADPKIFTEPTMFDALMQVGILPTMFMIGVAGYLIYKLVSLITVRRKES